MHILIMNSFNFLSASKSCVQISICLHFSLDRKLKTFHVICYIFIWSQEYYVLDQSILVRMLCGHNCINYISNLSLSSKGS